MSEHDVQLASEETFLASYHGRRFRAKHHDREVLTFRIGPEIYGVDIEAMREISKLRPVTEVPRAPGFLPGIITLRGTVVPIIDLRMRMGLAAAEPTRASRILIVDYDGEPYGLIVDAVIRVVRMVDDQIEASPLPGGIDSEFLTGLARDEGDLIVLLNLAAVVTFPIEVDRER